MDDDIRKFQGKPCFCLGSGKEGNATLPSVEEDVNFIQGQLKCFSRTLKPIRA